MRENVLSDAVLSKCAAWQIGPAEIELAERVGRETRERIADRVLGGENLQIAMREELPAAVTLWKAHHGEEVAAYALHCASSTPEIAFMLATRRPSAAPPWWRRWITGGREARR